PAIICHINDESALAFGVIENIQRQDLNPIEEAIALKRLQEEYGLTHDQVANSVGYSRSLVTNKLRLLNLAPLVRDYLIQKKIEVGHAKVLLVLEEEKQMEAAKHIIEKSLSVRETERFIKNKK